MSSVSYSSSSSYLFAFLSIRLSGLLQHSTQDGANSTFALSISDPMCQICKLCICSQNISKHLKGKL